VVKQGGQVQASLNRRLCSEDTPLLDAIPDGMRKHPNPESQPSTLFPSPATIILKREASNFQRRGEPQAVGKRLPTPSGGAAFETTSPDAHSIQFSPIRSTTARASTGRTGADLGLTTHQKVEGSNLWKRAVCVCCRETSGIRSALRPSRPNRGSSGGSLNCLED
jgi:hypothetical protein